MPLTYSRLRSGKTQIAGGFEPIEKARKSDIEMAEKLAAQYEPKIARAVQQLLDNAVENLDMKMLIDALQSGDSNKVLAIVDAAFDAAQAAMNGAVIQSLQDAVWGAGVASTLAMPGTAPAIVAAEFHFDRINPALVRWLQEYDLGLIKQINGPTREAVRSAMIGAISAPGGSKGPAAQALKIKEAVGLTPRMSKSVANYRKELETFHLKRTAPGWELGKGPDKVNGHNVFKPGADGAPKDGVINRRLRDLRFDPTLKRAIATRKPLTPGQIDKQVAAYARRWRAHRANNIARTESMRMANAGIHESFRQAIDKGVLSEDLVRRRWVVTDDERLCEHCAPIPGMNPKLGVKFAQPFATPVGPVMMGPLHPSCRCPVFIYTIEPSQLATEG